MVNEEHDCQSQIFESLFSNHSKTMMLKTKEDIHAFSAVVKVVFDMLLLENIISDIGPSVSNKQENEMMLIPTFVMILYGIIY